LEWILKCLVRVWSFSWQPSFVLPFLCHSRPHDVHVLDHCVIIQICECAIRKQWSAVFQIVLVQWSSLVQLFVVKHENSSREQITSHIITYRFYVAFHKLFVGGSSQHICHGWERHFSGCWANFEVSSCLSAASNVACTWSSQVIWISSSLPLWGFALSSLLICISW
jgi:hypothetical protein